MVYVIIMIVVVGLFVFFKIWNDRPNWKPTDKVHCLECGGKVEFWIHYEDDPSMIPGEITADYIKKIYFRCQSCEKEWVAENPDEYNFLQ
ncbi:MAG: zinc-ribbon domain-containing protein [Patescibacteria group bacterium]|nr:zinc-ribbon domain-containing protein [Patescibacteria group bacterium]